MLVKLLIMLLSMIPGYVHPALQKPISTLFNHLLAAQPANTPPMFKAIPFPQYSPSLLAELNDESSVSSPPTASYWTYPVTSSSSDSRQRRKTHVMATLNMTPDSFSDGSLHNTVSTALQYAFSSTTNGADIIDIGGYSTRPHAAYISPSEELDRVIPIIKAIRSTRQEEDDSAGQTLANALISIDTFREEVARAAIGAGANCINDVYAFTGPEYPLTVSSAEHFVRMRMMARQLAVPVILMHSRGEASANKDYSAYSYAVDADGRGSVLEGVRIELGAKVEAAVKGRGGLRRWQVIVDPGIGFSKTVEGNLELLRNASALTCDEEHVHGRGGALGANAQNPLRGFPQLIGVSRKSFIGMVLEHPDKYSGPMLAGRKTRPDERVWGTAAAVSCAVQQKAAVVRVHDVSEMRDVVTLSTALWG